MCSVGEIDSHSTSTVLEVATVLNRLSLGGALPNMMMMLHPTVEVSIFTHSGTMERASKAKKPLTVLLMTILANVWRSVVTLSLLMHMPMIQLKVSTMAVSTFSNYSNRCCQVLTFFFLQIEPTALHSSSDAASPIVLPPSEVL